jgi:hypothetical protein
MIVRHRRVALGDGCDDFFAMCGQGSRIGVLSLVVLALRPEFSTPSPNATDGAIRATRREAGVKRF